MKASDTPFWMAVQPPQAKRVDGMRRVNLDDAATHPRFGPAGAPRMKTTVDGAGFTIRPPQYKAAARQHRYMRGLGYRRDVPSRTIRALLNAFGAPFGGFSEMRRLATKPGPSTRAGDAARTALALAVQTLESMGFAPRTIRRVSGLKPEAHNRLRMLELPALSAEAYERIFSPAGLVRHRVIGDLSYEYWLPAEPASGAAYAPAPIAAEAGLVNGLASVPSIPSTFALYLSKFTLAELAAIPEAIAARRHRTDWQNDLLNAVGLVTVVATDNGASLTDMAAAFGIPESERTLRRLRDAALEALVETEIETAPNTITQRIESFVSEELLNV